MEKVLLALRHLNVTDLFTVMKQSVVEMEKYSTDFIQQPRQKATQRTKSNAKLNEALDVKAIVDALNNPTTQQGKQLTDAFKVDTGLTISAARQATGAGGRKTHYDFEILVDDVWYKVEHKGSKAYRAIDVTQPPWKGGVQFYNGTGKNYTLGHIYAREWYNRYILTGKLATKYGLTEVAPDYETWFTKDAMRQGDPTTPFGKELRSKFRGSTAVKAVTAVTAVVAGGGCFDERDEMVRSLVLSDSDVETLKEEVLTTAQSVLKEKDYWLQINGDINGKFYCKWNAPLVLTAITDVKRVECSDLLYEFSTDMGFPITAILRWGKGQGLSNIRIDLK